MGNDQSKGISDRRTYLNTSPSALACAITLPQRMISESSTGSNHLNIQEDTKNQLVYSSCSLNYKSTNSDSTSPGYSNHVNPLIIPKCYGEKLIFDDNDDETKMVQVLYNDRDDNESSINHDDNQTSLVERGSSCGPFARKPVKAESIITKTILDKDNTSQKEGYGMFNKNTDKVIDNSVIETTMPYKFGSGKDKTGVDSLNRSFHTVLDTGINFPSHTVVEPDFSSSHTVLDTGINFPSLTVVNADFSRSNPAEVKFLNHLSHTAVDAEFTSSNSAEVKLLNNPSSNTEIEPTLSAQKFDKMIASIHAPDSGICCDDREARRCGPMLGSRPDYSRFVSSDTDLEASLNYSASGSLLSNRSRLFTLEDIECIDDEGVSSETESVDYNADKIDAKHNDVFYVKQDHLLLDGATNIGRSSSPPSDTSTNLGISSLYSTDQSCHVGISGETRKARGTDRGPGKERSSQAGEDTRFCESVPDGAVGGRDDDGSLCCCSDEFAAGPCSYPCATTRGRNSCRRHDSSAGTGADAMENHDYHGGPAQGVDGGVPSSEERFLYGRGRMQLNNPRINMRTYYVAYLACPADDLSLFGLSFHEKLESWGQHICIPERDLPANGAKYKIMAKWLQDFCRGKVIVVISKNYANSDECQFITYFAKTLDPDAHRSSIIPVVIDKNVEIPAILSGLSIINYNFLYKKRWLKSKLINAIAA